MAEVPLIRVKLSGGGRSRPRMSAADAADLARQKALDKWLDDSFKEAQRISDALGRQYAREQDRIAKRGEQYRREDEQYAYRQYIRRQILDHQNTISRERDAAMKVHTIIGAARGDVAGTSAGFAKAAAVKMLGSGAMRELAVTAVRAAPAAGAAFAAAKFLGSTSYSFLSGLLGGAFGGTFGSESIRQMFAEPFNAWNAAWSAAEKATAVERAKFVSGSPLPVNIDTWIETTNKFAAIEREEQRVKDRLAADISHEMGKVNGNAMYKELHGVGVRFNRFLRGIGGG